MKKKYNNGKEIENAVHNSFTAYVKKSLINNRNSFYKKYCAEDICEFRDNMDDDISGVIVPDNDVETLYERECESEENVNSYDFDTIENTSLLKALSFLSKEDKMIIKLHVLCNHTYKEIAMIMDMTPSAVSTRYSRAIALLKNKMEGMK